MTSSDNTPATSPEPEVKPEAEIEPEVASETEVESEVEQVQIKEFFSKCYYVTFLNIIT